MGDVFIKLISLFICMIVGFFAYRRKIVNDAFNEGVSKIIINITLPCTIIVSLQKEFSIDRLKDSIIILVSSFFIHVFSILLGHLYCKINKTPDKQKGVTIFAITFPNVSFLGIPVLTAIYGQDVVFFVSFVNVVFTLLSFTYGMKLLSIGYKSDFKMNFNRILKNIPIIATLLGFTFFISGAILPKIVIDPIETLGSLTTPLAMILVGSTLGKSNIKAIFKNKNNYLVSLLRLIIIPILIHSIFRIFISSMYLVNILTFIFAMPVASSTAIIAEELKGNTTEASQLIFITALFSLVTIPFLVWLYPI